MVVFLAGIIQGSIPKDTIHDQNWREAIKTVLARHAPESRIYCHYTEHPNSITYDGEKIVQTFEDGLRRAVNADLVIAYLPEASMGTAIEMYEASSNNVPVICITPLEANWVVRIYADRTFPDLAGFEQFLASGELAQLLAGRK